MRSFRDWGRDCICPPGCDNFCGHRFDKQYGQLPLGYDHKYVYSHFGYNLKATDMQAAVGCAQTYPTAGDALFSLMDANKVISFTQSGGYVDTISDVNGKTLSGYTSEDWTTYYGWYYCVMHRDGSDADFVEGSSVMSASVVPVESGDKVVWAFGTEDQTNEYFAEVLEQYQNGTV